MSKLFNHFRNSFLTVFFTSLIPLALSFYDVDFCWLALLIFSYLPVLFLLDVCLWFFSDKNDTDKEPLDLELLQKELNKFKNK